MLRAVIAVSAVSLFAAIVGCSGDCDEKKREAICKKAGGAPAAAGPSGDLTSFEEGQIGPILEDLRGGVRPYNEQGIGICRGAKTCDEYLGMEVEDLAEGEYILMAELKVPELGSDWTITLNIECERVVTTANSENRSTKTSSKTYKVKYVRYAEPRGYRLMPLRTIESPSHGQRTCEYKLMAPHPDGDKVYSGSWSTPPRGP